MQSGVGFDERYFFSNFGPNSTTFILPSETFPTEAIKGRLVLWLLGLAGEDTIFEEDYVVGGRVLVGASDLGA